MALLIKLVRRELLRKELLTKVVPAAVIPGLAELVEPSIGGRSGFHSNGFIPQSESIQESTRLGDVGSTSVPNLRGFVSSAPPLTLETINPLVSSARSSREKEEQCEGLRHVWQIENMPSSIACVKKSLSQCTQKV